MYLRSSHINKYFLKEMSSESNAYLCCMARIMSIDYGTKRVGIAVTDPGQIIATSLDTIHASKVIEYLKVYFAKEEVEALVVGDPIPVGADRGKMAKLTDNFVKSLQKAFPELPIHRFDERFTSRMASQVIAMSGMGKIKRQDKSLVDKISATIILQDYMQYKK